jgi:hypothetical protein
VSRAPGAAPADATTPGRTLPRRPPRSLRASASAVGLALASAVLVGGCWGAGLAPPPVPTGETPAPSVSAPMQATKVQLEGTLRAAGISLMDEEAPYRPAESAALAAAPRIVLRAVLPDDPAQGRIVVYDLGDPQAAYAAAREMAAYLATGPGRIQFPPDTRFALRLIGSTVVFSTWSAANAPDPADGERLMVLLDSVGIAVPIQQT